MTPQEKHRLTHDRIMASLLLADTRATRHGVYARRKAKKAHTFVVPTVTERKPL